MSRVLVVDGSRFDREYITRILKSRGYDVIEARDGPDGLELARSRKPELILTSSVLSSMDGYEFVRRLRCEGPLMQTPVVFSARTKEEDLARALARSCDVRFVLDKRSNPADVLKTVESALQPAETGPDGSDSRSEANLGHRVAHDLRFPLQAIIGFCDILLSDHADKLDQTGKECLVQISTASRRMNQLIGDLLETSQSIAAAKVTSL